MAHRFGPPACAKMSQDLGPKRHNNDNKKNKKKKRHNDMNNNNDDDDDANNNNYRHKLYIYIYREREI